MAATPSGVAAFFRPWAAARKAPGEAAGPSGTSLFHGRRDPCAPDSAPTRAGLPARKSRLEYPVRFGPGPGGAPPNVEPTDPLPLDVRRRCRPSPARRPGHPDPDPARAALVRLALRSPAPARAQGPERGLRAGGHA